MFAQVGLLVHALSILNFDGLYMYFLLYMVEMFEDIKVVTMLLTMIAKRGNLKLLSRQS